MRCFGERGPVDQRSYVAPPKSLLLVLLILIAAWSWGCAPTPTPTPTELPPTRTATPSATPTPTLTTTPTPTPTPTATPLPLAVSVELDPLQPIQGGLLVIRAMANQRAAFEFSFDGQTLPAVRLYPESCEALVGLDVCEPPDEHILRVEAYALSGQRVSFRSVVPVQAGTFITEWLTIPPDRLALLDPEITRPEAQQVAEVCSAFSETRHWEGAFQLPWEGKTNSPFGARRSYAGESPNSCHTGIDIDGEGGEPVRAANAGIVALAEELDVRGNAVILDHGWGVFSAYWHLAEILTQPGEMVESGQVVGLLGSTGLATGAHLHWEVRVHNVPVDPLIFVREKLAESALVW
jgi:hypothetical protein